VQTVRRDLGTSANCLPRPAMNQQTVTVQCAHSYGILMPSQGVVGPQ